MMLGAIASFFESPYADDILLYCIPIVAIIAYFWSETLKNRSNNELKRAMIERGMSAHEIQQVIDAGAEKEDKTEGKKEMGKE